MTAYVTALPGARVQWFGPLHIGAEWTPDSEWGWRAGTCTRREAARAWVLLDTGEEIYDHAHLLRVQAPDGRWWARGRPMSAQPADTQTT